MAAELYIRQIEPRDDAALANIIRATLTEFGANKPGTVYYDPTTDHLSEIFKKEKSIYYIVEFENKVVGGAGIYPTDGLGDLTCELVKMYLLPTVRGKGLAPVLLQRCFEFAEQAGYKNIYIETMPELAKAVRIYEKAGFEKIPCPLGQSGHFGCDIWMLKKLSK